MGTINVFITTKGRYNNCKTADLFGNYASLYLVVEPQEYEKYKANYPNVNIMVLPVNNNGLSYARNYIKAHTIEKGIKFYWLLDDDISHFYKRNGTKLIRTIWLDCLYDATKLFMENNIACGGLEYRQFAWSANKRLIQNSFCDSAVYINNELTEGLWYNEDLKLKIDRDFCIKVINAGQKTGRDTMNAFSVPPNGSNAGGLKEVAYDIIDLEKNMCKKMVEIWGEDICTHIVKPDGRNDLKIHWNNINSKQTKLF
jgi:hypothetical protein